MGYRAAALALCLAAAPLAAQETVPEPELPPEENGRSLMEEGARLFMRGILDELEPTLRELEGLSREIEPAMRDFAREMGPALRDLLAQVEDWSAYHPPEILPNGDIIIRRKETAPELPEEEPQGPVDL